MEITAFRIRNFRSIVDTGWCNLSPDGVTVLVGQNESGKSSILDALSASYDQFEVGSDDLRVDGNEPLVELRFHVPSKDLENILSECDKEIITPIKAISEKNRDNWDLLFSWPNDRTDKRISGLDFSDGGIQETILKHLKSAHDKAQTSKRVLSTIEAIANLNLKKNDTDTAEVVSASTEAADSQDVADVESALTAVPGEKDITDKSIKEKHLRMIDLFLSRFWKATPGIEHFKSSEALLLPNEVELDESGLPVGKGAVAAKNFQQVANLDSKKAVSSDPRMRENALSRANRQINEDFGKFWSQLIGNDLKIEFECGIDKRFEKGVEKTFLVFWTKEGVNKLYPSQRSEGVRWFVSFYLHFRAAALKRSSFVFLLDEPGANLHPKAQLDALKLINTLSKNIRIVYSTHSPIMIEYEKLFRILVVQRISQEEFSPTTVIAAHNLAAASRDSLSPVLAAMGADLSQQDVIKKENNVILEELSAFYYLKALWRLSGRTKSAYFVAATGASNVPVLANMFLGWGLEFVVLVDDDQAGRRILQELKRDLLGENEEQASRQLLKLKNCKGVEDLFSRDDFSKHIQAREGSLDSNSEFVKEKCFSKVVLAYKFYQKIIDGKLTFKDLDNESRLGISELFDKLESILK